MLKRDKGITLIALVVTIIVLLILAAISISMLTGDNGILTKAKEARDRTREENAKEIVQIEVLGSYGIDGNIDTNLLNKNLKTIKGLTHGGKTLDENPITSLPAFVELDGFKIKIDSAGNVSIENKDSNETEEIDPIYARLYNKNNSEEEVLVLASKKDAFPDYSGELILINDMGNINPKKFYTYEDLLNDPVLGEYFRSEEWEQIKKNDLEYAKEFIDSTLYEYNYNFVNAPWLTDTGTGSYGYWQIANLNLTEARILDEIYPISMSGWFQQTSLKKIDGIENINTSKVKNIDGMFAMCETMTELDLSGFKVSNVINMEDMFFSCKKLKKLDLSSFDTSNVINMESMFAYCESLTQLNLSNFDTSNVTNMEMMFRDCKSLLRLDLSSFNTSNVTNIMYMFTNCNNLTEVVFGDKFDTKKVVNMGRLFNGCEKLTKLDFSRFDTSNVLNMENMFAQCKGLTELDLSNFNIASAENMERMFKDCTNLTEILVGSNWKIPETAKTTDMFLNCGVSEVTGPNS